MNGDAASDTKEIVVDVLKLERSLRHPRYVF